MTERKATKTLTWEDALKAAEAGDNAFGEWVEDKMKYKAEGEAADGSYLDGLWFETQEDAQREVWLLSQEFPENNYWLEVDGE